MPPTALMRGRELLQFLLQSSVGRGRALDIGCGEGAFGRGLLAAGFEQVWGVEPNQLTAACAARVITGLVSSAFPNDGLDHISPFDLVIFADSLEHMIDPWAALAKARALLKPDGVLLLSLPMSDTTRSCGTSSWVAGHTPTEGLLDRGHLRFFTPTTAIEALHEAGFSLVSRRDVMGPPGGLRHLPLRALGLLSADIFVVQALLLARPTPH